MATHTTPNSITFFKSRIGFTVRLRLEYRPRVRMIGSAIARLIGLSGGGRTN